MKRLLCGALALGLAGAARAHDSWLEPLPPATRGELRLSLGTGTQYPTYELPVVRRQVDRSGCRADGVPATALDGVDDRPDTLSLRARKPVAEAPGLVCWAQLVPIDIADIPPDKVALYFDEINASPALRAARAAQVARGLPWQERYVKHARIELDTPRAGPAAAAPVPMGMDAVMTAPRRPVQVGDALVFQVLRDGRPLPDQPIEFRSNLSRFGFWRRTDAEGRVRFTPPVAARWLLRGVDLRLADGDADRWDSRFLTLVFDVAPAR